MGSLPGWWKVLPRACVRSLPSLLPLTYLSRPPGELCRGLLWRVLRLHLVVLVFKFCSSLDPDARFKAQIYKVRGIKEDQ